MSVPVARAIPPRNLAYRALVAVLAVAATWLHAGWAYAQVVPEGAHHLNVGPAASEHLVTPNGAFSASVPLQLPPSRGTLPLPLSIVHTGNPRVQAAGAGWDIPLSYLRVSTSTMRRKPTASDRNPDGSPAAAKRVVVSIGGDVQYMAPTPNPYLFRPFSAKTYAEVHYWDNNSWTMTTADGLRYLFTLGQWIDPSASARLPDPDMYYLTEISRIDGRDKVVLDYRVTACGDDQQVNLTGLRYTFQTDGKNPLYDVRVLYSPSPNGWAVSQTRDGGYSTSRCSTASRVEVHARENHRGGADKIIRAYDLAYQTDPDTESPRLAAVTMTGEDNGRASTPLPVAKYIYGNATTFGESLDKRKPATYQIPLPYLVGRGSHYANAIASSSVERWIDVVPDPVTNIGITYTRETVRSTALLHDFTGDGLPDYVYKDGDQWRMVVSRGTGNRVDLYDNTSAQPSTSVTWKEPSDLSVQTSVTATNGYVAGAPAAYAPHYTETWVTFLDWNGDGLTDVVDAQGSSWTVWLNGGVVDGTLSWRPIYVDIDDLISKVKSLGYSTKADPVYSTKGIPLERSRTAPNVYVNDCKKRFYTRYFVSHPGAPDDGEARYKYAGDQIDDGPCGGASMEAAHRTGQLDTFREWALNDANGDSYPDFVVSQQPVERCVRSLDYGHDRSGDCAPLSVVDERNGYFSSMCGESVRSFIRPGHPRCDFPWEEVLPRQPPKDPLAVAYLNSAGVVETSAHPFRTDAPIAIDDSVHGLGWWSNAPTQDEFPRFDDTGVGSTYSISYDDLGDPDADGLSTVAAENFTFETDRPTVCRDESSRGTFHTKQTRGLVDINGDGLPDLVYRTSISPSAWVVRFGAGMKHFGQPQPIRMLSNDEFAISETEGHCNGGSTRTVRGLLDIDGDGRPELIAAIDGGGLNVSSLAGLDTYPELEDPAHPGQALNQIAGTGIGRLVGIDNGYGAVTRIDYDNNKLEARTSHGVPHPEIVVARTWVDVLPGYPGTGTAPTYFAYGGALRQYDPIWARWESAGYERTLTITGLLEADSSQVAGSAVVTDRRLSRFFPWFMPHSHSDWLVASLPQRVSLLEGRFSRDPRELLTVSVEAPFFPDERLRGGRTMSYGVVEVGNDGSSQECGDVNGANGEAGEDTGLCGRAGVLYTKREDAWEGFDSMGDSNVQVRTDIVGVDNLGRPTRVYDYGDVRTAEDDTCRTISYAAPTNGAPWFLTAVSSVFTDECGLTSRTAPDDPTPGNPLRLAGVRFYYDGSTTDGVVLGRMTRRLVEQYDISNGTLLNAMEVMKAGPFDAFGNPTHIERPRAASATQVTDITYDLYGLTPTATTTTSTDQGTSLHQDLYSSVIPSEISHVDDAAGVRHLYYRDPFGRPKYEFVSSTRDIHDAYLLKQVQFDDTTTRRIVRMASRPAASLDHADLGLWQEQKTFLDALGRPQSIASNKDGHSATWMSEAIQYDRMGRVVYRSSPQKTTFLPYDPPSTNLPYGTTYFYGWDGDLEGTIVGPGRASQMLGTDTSVQRFTSNFAKGYTNGQRIDFAWGPKDMDPTSPTYGAHSETLSNGSGWVMQTSRVVGIVNRVDVVDHQHDRFGHENETIRHGDDGATVRWSATYDSFGNVVTRTEPGSQPVRYRYDEWGALTESRWTEGDVTHMATWNYDGFARPTSYRLDDVKGGVNTPQWKQYYYYDEASGSEHQPASRSLKGRLSYIRVPGIGDEYYAYDDLGRGVSTTTVHADDGVPYRTTQKLDLGGRVQSLRFDIPGHSETATYHYDNDLRADRISLGDGVDTRTVFTANQIDDFGRYRDVTLGNGTRETYQFEATGLQRMTGWAVQSADSRFQRVIDGRDADGRITAQHEVQGSTTTTLGYEYDVLGRLTRQVATGGQARDERFSYDGLGNLRSGPDGTIQYGYEGFDRDRLTAVGAPGAVMRPLSYDGAGNVTLYTPIDKPALELAYDGASRLTSMKSGSGAHALFTYGPGGALFRESVDGADGHQEIRHYGSLIERHKLTNGHTFVELRVPGPLGTVASVRLEGSGENAYRVINDRETIYPHGDTQANRLFTDADGKVVQDASFAAYGAVTDSTGSPNSMVYTDDLWNAGNTYAEFGVDVLGARVYDPRIGRFLQRDPLRAVGSASRGNPYAFSWNDPVNLADPSGLSPFGDVLGWLGSSLSSSSSGAEPTGLPTGTDVVGIVGASVGLIIAHTVNERIASIKPLSPRRMPRSTTFWPQPIQDAGDAFVESGLSLLENIGYAGNGVMDCLSGRECFDAAVDAAPEFGRRLNATAAAIAYHPIDTAKVMACGGKCDAKGVGRGLFKVFAVLSGNEVLGGTEAGGLVARTEAVGKLAGEESVAAAGAEAETAVEALAESETAAVGEYLAGKAPQQVAPGVRTLEGQYVNDLGRVEPWRAHYDQFGRQIGRTDYNAGNATQKIPNVHHHIYDWTSRGQAGREVVAHAPGEFVP